MGPGRGGDAQHTVTRRLNNPVLSMMGGAMVRRTVPVGTGLYPREANGPMLLPSASMIGSLIWL